MLPLSCPSIHVSIPDSLRSGRLCDLFRCSDLGEQLAQNCEIHEIATQAYISGSLTAQKRSSPDENTGFVFINCLITGIGTGQVFLGRAWGPYSRVVYIYTYMDDVILPEGWQDWSNPSRERLVSFHFLLQ